MKPSSPVVRFWSSSKTDLLFILTFPEGSSCFGNNPAPPLSPKKVAHERHSKFRVLRGAPLATVQNPPAVNPRLEGPKHIPELCSAGGPKASLSTSRRLAIVLVLDSFSREPRAQR
jgi:hypothetical protein